MESQAKETSEKKETGKTKKAAKRSVPVGRVHIQATFNNTMVTLTDPHGNVLAWASAGNCGFKGPKKSTPYAASVVVKSMAEKAIGFGTRDVDVFVVGLGAGRDSAIRALNSNGFQIRSLTDATPIPHNGCRLPRRRRI
jgi:small subunit ribosomal protein S11